MATQVKTPTSKYEIPNQNYYYWPSSQFQTPNHFMTTLPRSPLNHSSQSNYVKSPSATKISSQSTSQLLNNSPLAYKSTGSSIPLLNNRFLNTNLFFSSTYSPSAPMISADKLVNLDAPLSPKMDSSVSCTNIDSYSSQLMNSNLSPSRSNSSNSLTLYTYLVQSGANKNLKKDSKTNHIRVQQQQQQHQSVKKNSDSNPHVDYRTATSTDLAQHLSKSHKFSSLADSFLNASSLTTSLSRTLNARRSVEPLMENQVNKSTLNGLYSPMRLRTTSANTISSTAIK